MKRPPYAAAIFIVLSTAGAAFAQPPTRTSEPENTCAMDYNCNTEPKGIGTDDTKATPVDPNVARLRNEYQAPTRNSNEPEEPEQPIQPEGPISNPQ